MTQDKKPPNLKPCVTCGGETYIGGIANTVKYCRGCNICPELCKCETEQSLVTCVHCGKKVQVNKAEEYEVDDIQGTVYYCEECWNAK